MTRPKAVYDASVIVRAVVDGSSDAQSWLESLRSGRTAVMAPDLFYAEVSNAFMRYVRKGTVGLNDATESLSAVVRLDVDVRPNRETCEAAFALAAATGLTAYDAHYLALAEAEDALLVTADRDLAAAASRSVLLE